MTRPRVLVGRDVRIVAERADGPELEGTSRLAPGRAVELVLTGAEGQVPEVVKPAIVWSWYVIRIGRAGTTYRGRCCWAPGVPGG